MQAGTTIGAVLRTDQAYRLHTSVAESLAWGVAFTSQRFAGLYEANQLREFAVSRPEDVPRAYAEVEAYYGTRGLTCLAWAPAAEQPAEVVGDFLQAKGYRRRELIVYALPRWPEDVASEGVRVLPARSLRADFERMLFETSAGGAEADRRLRAEAGLERLDDAAYEAVVASVDGQPAGCCALFQVGDIGRVVDFGVSPAFRAAPAGEALLLHVLVAARRYMTRKVCLEVATTDDDTRRCAEDVGFVEDGRTVEFRHPEAVVAGE